MIRDGEVTVDGQRWRIRQAVSMEAAMNEIAHARVLGSVGSSSTLDETRIGGTVKTIADVVKLNSDGSERRAYQQPY